MCIVAIAVGNWLAASGTPDAEVVGVLLGGAGGRGGNGGRGGGLGFEVQPPGDSLLTPRASPPPDPPPRRGGGDGARPEPHHPHHDRHGRDGHWVSGTDAEQEALEEPGHGHGAHQTESDADPQEPAAVGEHHAEHAPGVRTQAHADSDLAGAPGDEERHDAADPHRRDDQGQHAECAHQVGVESLRGDRLLPDLLQGGHPRDGVFGRHLPGHPLGLGGQGSRPLGADHERPGKVAQLILGERLVQDWGRRRVQPLVPRVVHDPDDGLPPTRHPDELKHLAGPGDLAPWRVLRAEQSLSRGTRSESPPGRRRSCPFRRKLARRGPSSRRP